MCTRQSLKAHALLKHILVTCNGKYTSKRQRTKRKMLATCTLHRVIFQVVFSLLLAFLEGSAIEKVRGMSLVGCHSKQNDAITFK